MKEHTTDLRPISLDVSLGLAVAVGITAGVIFSLNMQSASLVGLCGIEDKLSLAGSGAWIGVFLRSFTGAAALISAAFILGFCALGQPFELFLMLFRGLGLGICVRGVYLSQNPLRSLAAFLPYAIVSTGIIMLGCKEAFRLSNCYLRLSLTAENRLGMRNEIRDYSLRFLIYMLMTAISALLDASLAVMLGRI